MISKVPLFKKILGSNWDLLHPAIQQRFAAYPATETSLTYRGELRIMYCSKFGKIIAMLTRPLLQGALMPYCAHHVPVEVKIYTKKNNRFF